MIEANKAVDEFVEEMPDFKEVIAVFLYGSLARKEYSRRHSDIDLLIAINKKKISSALSDRIEKRISAINAKYKVRIHAEYQPLNIIEEDRSLLRKIIEEGKLIYSSGIFVLGKEQLGLKAYYVFTFSAKERSKQTRLSQILHGRKSWYYKGKNKIVKSYPGIIDEKSVIELGKGCIMVSADKRVHIEQMLDRMGINYKMKKIIYGV